MNQRYPVNYAQGFPQFPHRNSPELLQEMPLRMRDRRDVHNLNMPMYAWVTLTSIAIFAVCYFLNASMNNQQMQRNYPATSMGMQTAR